MSHRHVVFFGAAPRSGANGVVPSLCPELPDTIFILARRVFVVGMVEPVRRLVWSKPVEPQWVAVRVLGRVSVWSVAIFEHAEPESAFQTVGVCDGLVQLVLLSLVVNVRQPESLPCTIVRRLLPSEPTLFKHVKSQRPIRFIQTSENQTLYNMPS